MIRITGMIYNTLKRAWHPVIFRDAPMPGPDGWNSGRVKSQGHHTTGFATREEANADVENHPHLQGVPFDRDYVYEWDGLGTPALTEFIIDGKLAGLSGKISIRLPGEPELSAAYTEEGAGCA